MAYSGLPTGQMTSLGRTWHGCWPQACGRGELSSISWTAPPQCQVGVVHFAGQLTYTTLVPLLGWQMCSNTHHCSMLNAHFHLCIYIVRSLILCWLAACLLGHMLPQKTALLWTAAWPEANMLPCGNNRQQRSNGSGLVCTLHCMTAAPWEQCLILIQHNFGMQRWKIHTNHVPVTLRMEVL